MKESNSRQKSLVVDTAARMIIFLNKYFTLSKWLIKGDKDIFYRVERLLLLVTAFSAVVLLSMHLMPLWLGLIISIIFIQRLIEFIVVYARNFIFGEGRIFTAFDDVQHRGEWLVMMFLLNVVQMVLIFAVWYRYIGLVNPNSFSAPMSILNSFYFSVVTLLTVGYGDIIPLTDLAKALVIVQSALTFYIFVVVVNGLISIHFTGKE